MLNITYNNNKREQGNALWWFHTRARQRQDDKTNVEPVHSCDAFHTRSDMSGVKGIIGMHRFNICLVVLLWCENTIRSDMSGVNRHHRNAQVQHLSCRCLALV